MRSQKGEEIRYLNLLLLITLTEANAKSIYNWTNGYEFPFKLVTKEKEVLCVGEVFDPILGEQIHIACPGELEKKCPSAKYCFDKRITEEIL